MGFKFEPKLFYKELGNGKVEITFQYKARAYPNKQTLIVPLDVFNEYRLFAETVDETRFRHLGNALNWDTSTEISRKFVFAILLLLYFPFQKTIQFQKWREVENG